MLQAFGGRAECSVLACFMPPFVAQACFHFHCHEKKFLLESSLKWLESWSYMGY
jgi:hypothetical protein